MKNYFCYENTKEMIRAVKVEPLNDNRLRVLFSNGEKKQFDVSPFLKDDKVFFPLKNKMFFDSVYLAGGSVAWSDEIDICPECLYWDSIPDITCS